jgi:peptide/nickel transport system permease protein
MPKIVLLWTDVVLYTMLLALAWYGWRIRVNDNLRANWWKVLRDPAAFSAAIVLALFALVTAADSVHFRRALAPSAGAPAGTQVFMPPRPRACSICCSRARWRCARPAIRSRWPTSA